MKEEVIEVAGGSDLDSQVAQAAFMEEFLDVMIHESTDPNAESVIPVGVNGRMVWLLRGQPLQLRRKYVEVLARSKTTAYKTVKGRSYDGSDKVDLVGHTALTYPFSVISDKNPQGAAWLRSVLAS